VSEDQMALLIPIITVTLSMTVAIVFIITRYRRNVQELEQRHRERMAAIDKGLDLPPEQVSPPAVTPPRYLLRGLVWLGVGLAIVFGARELLDSDAASLGWIPAAVGVAYLIFYMVEGRKESKVAAHDK
jgi:hypothetical protein